MIRISFDLTREDCTRCDIIHELQTVATSSLRVLSVVPYKVIFVLVLHVLDYKQFLH
jgi:hypothetical protein